MRILHILDHSLPLHSGYTFRTLAILREQRALGWETFQLTSPKHYAASEAEETLQGWHFFRTPAAKGAAPNLPGAGELQLMAATAARVDEVAQRVRPDILHAHSPVLNALPALWVGRRRNLPVVYEMRASWEDAAVDHGTTHEGSVRYRASRALETFALRNTAQITTICEGLRREIVGRGVPARRVTVVPNAVDVETFRAGMPDAALRAALGLERSLVLGFAGSFYAYEGLDLLIDALPLLLARTPHLKLLLLGGGPQEQALREQVRELRLDPHVVFAGRVPHADVQRHYDLMDVLVYPRRSMRLTELVTPLKPLEAMAQSRLVVASDVGGHRELIRAGETGYLFTAGDLGALATTLADVLARREAWTHVRQAARRFVEQERTWRISVRNYIGVYRAALAGRGELATA
jgi:PEP-CTERM/exosortase A-associated glycosyltransferase